MGNSSPSKYLLIQPEEEIGLHGGEIIIQTIRDEISGTGRIRYISYRNKEYFLYRNHPKFVELSKILAENRPRRLICTAGDDKIWRITEAGPVRTRRVIGRVKEVRSIKDEISNISLTPYLEVVLEDPVKSSVGNPIRLLLDRSRGSEVKEGSTYRFEFSLFGAPEWYLIKGVN